MKAIDRILEGSFAGFKELDITPNHTYNGYWRSVVADHKYQGEIVVPVIHATALDVESALSFIDKKVNAIISRCPDRTPRKIIHDLEILKDNVGAYHTLLHVHIVGGDKK